MHKLDPGVVLICVGSNPVVDVPYQQAFAGEELIAVDSLAIFDEEVFLAFSIAICPEAMDLVTILDITECDRAVTVFYYSLDPALIRLAPYVVSETHL